MSAAILLIPFLLVVLDILCVRVAFSSDGALSYFSRRTLVLDKIWPGLSGLYATGATLFIKRQAFAGF